MKISREDLLSQLESVQPGLSQKEIIEHGQHFIFLKGRIVTFNSEVACTIPTSLRIRGAVRAIPLLAILNKMNEENVNIEQDDSGIIIKGKNRRTTIYMEKEIHLAIEKIEKPNRWYPLAQEFCEAVEIARSCTGKNTSQFTSTCVHLTPRYLEASDNVQVARYPVRTKLKSSIIVVGDFLKHVAEAEVTEFSQGESWIHFRNKTGLIVSCRISSDEDYPDLGDSFNVDGAHAVLPPGLIEAAKRAQVFSQDNLEKDRVIVRLNGNQLHIKGEGVSGWHIEASKINYKGKPIQFTIIPVMLMDIVSRHNDCYISRSHLKIDTGSYQYVTCLGQFESKKKKKKKKK